MRYKLMSWTAGLVRSRSAHPDGALRQDFLGNGANDGNKTRHLSPLLRGWGTALVDPSTNARSRGRFGAVLQPLRRMSRERITPEALPVAGAIQSLARLIRTADRFSGRERGVDRPARTA